MAAILSENNYSNDSSNTNTTSFPMFCKEGIESSQLKIKDGGTVRFRILPSLDLSSSSAENFYETVVPYKNPDGSLTNWVVMVKGYTFFGQLNTNFLSPATYHMSAKYPPRGCDPVKDLAAFIKFNAKEMYPGTNTPLITDDELLLINGVEGDIYSKILPQRPRVFALINALVENPTTKIWKAQILVMPEYILENFTQVLKQKTGRNDKIIDPNFEDFLFGDVTSPEYGCVNEARINNKLKIGNTELCASATNEDLVGYVPMPITKEDLLKRKFLHDADHVLDVKTSQEVLDILCKDPAIPLDTLKKAYEFKAFDPSLSLNLDLREEGLEILRKREERKNRNAAGESAPFSGVKVATRVAAAPAPAKPSIPFPKPVAQAAPAKPPVVVIGDMRVPNPSASELESPNPPKFEEEEEGEIPMGNEGKVATSAEADELKALQDQMTNNPASLTPDMINRYIALKQKLNA